MSTNLTVNKLFNVDLHQPLIFSISSLADKNEKNVSVVCRSRSRKLQNKVAHFTLRNGI